jgi:hypothetical protein
MRCRGVCLLCLLVLPFLAPSAHANSILGPQLTAFGVLAGPSITNIGSTTVTGNWGTSPGAAIDAGISAGAFGSVQANSGLAALAQQQLTAAVGALNGMAFTGTFGTVAQLGNGGATPSINPGVYSFGSSAAVTGLLLLNAQGNANAVWVFQIPSTLVLNTGASVQVTNGGLLGGVFWVVGSAATLNASSSLVGNILAASGIQMLDSATISCGRALTPGAVTLSNNTINSGCAGSSFSSSNGLSGGINFTPGPGPGGSGGTATVVPEPATFGLLLVGLTTLLPLRKLRKVR